LSKSYQLYDGLRSVFGDTKIGVMMAETIVASAVFGLPTIGMGATFALLVESARGAHGGVGWGVGLNTLGGALAAPLFGVAFLPVLGSKWTCVLIALGYLALVPRLSLLRSGLMLLALALLFVLPRDLRILQIPTDAKIRAYRDGAMSSVAVVEDG